MPGFTTTQGRYLAFIRTYTEAHGRPPAESEIAAAMCVSAPSVNQMVKSLEKKGLISRKPGQARSLEILVPDEEIPDWGNRKRARSGRPSSAKGAAKVPPVRHPPAALYTFDVYLTSGPISEKHAKGPICRTIEIRGDQTLEELHLAIFKAFDRWDEHLFEFQMGKKPFDPKGPNYGVMDPRERKAIDHDARTTKIDDLKLVVGRVFGYWFDFGDDWLHQVEVSRLDKAIPTVTYPRVVMRMGKSPPQYPGE